MLTSSNVNIFRVTGPIRGEFTGHRWIPYAQASGAELWCFLWSAPWINGWVNNRKAGDLRRHRAHYDVIVMTMTSMCLKTSVTQHFAQPTIKKITNAHHYRRFVMGGFSTQRSSHVESFLMPPHHHKWVAVIWCVIMRPQSEWLILMCRSFSKNAESNYFGN